MDLETYRIVKEALNKDLATLLFFYLCRRRPFKDELLFATSTLYEYCNRDKEAPHEEIRSVIVIRSITNSLFNKRRWYVLYYGTDETEDEIFCLDWELMPY